jgi:hypothetical protein
VETCRAVCLAIVATSHGCNRFAIRQERINGGSPTSYIVILNRHIRAEANIDEIIAPRAENILDALQHWEHGKVVSSAVRSDHPPMIDVRRRGAGEIQFL